MILDMRICFELTEIVLKGERSSVSLRGSFFCCLMRSTSSMYCAVFGIFDARKSGSLMAIVLLSWPSSGSDSLLFLYCYY